MKKALITSILFTLIFSSYQLRASHATGGDLNLACVGGDSFRVTLKLFRDCSGLSAPLNADVTIFDSCTSFTSTLPLISSVDVTPFCSQYKSNSACNNGSLPGIEEYVYQKTITIPNCTGDTLTASYSLSMRNQSNNLSIGSGSGDFCINTTLNTSTVICNTQPVFTSSPVAFYCAGQEAIYNPGVIEPEGDSLYFRFAEPLEDTNTPIGFQSPYSYTNPFPVPVTLNHQTGSFTFIPISSMVTGAPNNYWSIKICADEYRDGVYIGTTCRESQVNINPASNCMNQSPYLISNGIQNLYTSGIQIDSNSFSICKGDSFYFEVQYADSLFGSQLPMNGGDSIFFSSNIIDFYSNTTISATQGDSATVSVSGTLPLNSPDTNSFYIEARDNSCPIYGKSLFQFDITTNEITTAGPDKIICRNSDSAIFNLKGGSYYTWSVVSGEPFNFNVNFSDTTNSNGSTIWASPDTTTTYAIQSNLNNNCTSTDTITVNVASDFNLTTFGDTVVCPTDSVNTFPLSAVVDSNFSYTYNWYPDSLNSDTISSPTATIKDDQLFFVTVKNSDGCSKNDSVQIDFFDGIPTNAGLDQTICQNTDTAFFTPTSGDTFYWSVLSGDPISVNSNFSDTSNSNGSSVWAQPNDTTIYLVESNLSGPCSNTDTIKVSVVPEFNLNPYGDTIICPDTSLYSFQLDANPNINHSDLMYEWTNYHKLNSRFDKNPVATINKSKTFHVTATIDSVCTVSDSVEIKFAIPTLKNAKITFEEDSICEGDTTEAFIKFNGPNLDQTCTTINDFCSSSNQTFATLSTGNYPIGGVVYPSPFGNAYKGARHQILYTAEEVRSVTGTTSGTPLALNSFGLDVETLGSQNTFNSFSISISCTNNSNLSSGWETGLTSVYSSPSEIITTGWNNFEFDNTYIWDGTSNIVIQVCFNNFSNSANGNAYTNTSTTSFVSVRYSRGNQGGVCFDNSLTQFTSSNRPNGKFGYCYGYSSNNYTYQWLPSNKTINDQAPSPSITPSKGSVYKLIYQDKRYGACIDTISEPITVFKKPNIDLGSEDTVLCGNSPFPVTLDPSSHNSNIDFVWSTGDTTELLEIYSENTYWVKAINMEKCSTFDTMLVESEPNPVVNLGSDSSVGPQKMVQLESGYPNLINLWSTGDSSSSIAFEVVSDTTIWNTVTDSNGCSGSDTINISISTGLKNIMRSNIKVYPNPAQDYLWVDIGEENKSTLYFSLLTINGQILKEGILNSKLNKIDISNFPSSSFQLILYNEEGSFLEDALIIKQ